jgi:nitrous oxidase accessory protein NosD
VTFTFKLARRTARFRPLPSRAFGASMLAATLALSACNPEEPTGPAADPEGVVATEAADAVPAAAGAQVAISPGQSIQSKVNSYPAGTQFLIKAGVHANQRVVPKSGNVFIGEPGAVLDGKNVVPYAFERGRKPYPSNVRIQGLTIQNYASPDQHGAILAGTGGSTASTGWVVQNCEVRYNKHAGIKVGHKMRVLNNYVHHNGQVGISGVGDSVLVEGNEVAYNNYKKLFPFGHVLGGIKMVSTRWLIVRGNNVHHNEGNGIWMDIRTVNGLVEKNTIVANSGAGVLHEIGYAAIIRDNTVKGNGFARDWLMGAGILISSSADAQVYGNTVLDNKQGIVGIQQKRSNNGYDFSSNLKNLNVHHNTVRVPSGGQSGVSSGVSTLTYTSRNNRFTVNSYDMGSDSKPFTWMNGKRSKTEWQKYGNDVNGTFY